jgi:hypothetical protein
MERFQAYRLSSRDIQIVAEMLPSHSCPAQHQDDAPSLDPIEQLDTAPVEGAFYAGQFIVQPKSTLTTAAKLRLIDSHSVFTGNWDAED